ncbi:hypothetical protein [Methanolapillus africanus]|uniref:hypothetical protein n=1 Tax=Methanolapillus africanus TaxID=3028297 RepID=UPI0030B87E0C
MAIFFILAAMPAMAETADVTNVTDANLILIDWVSSADDTHTLTLNASNWDTDGNGTISIPDGINNLTIVSNSDSTELSVSIEAATRATILNLTIKDLNLDLSTATNKHGIDIDGVDGTTLFLEGNNTITGNLTGIHVGFGNFLIITANVSVKDTNHLSVYGGPGSAGIGGKIDESSGKIVINGFVNIFEVKGGSGGSGSGGSSGIGGGGGGRSRSGGTGTVIVSDSATITTVTGGSGSSGSGGGSGIGGGGGSGSGGGGGTGTVTVSDSATITTVTGGISSSSGGGSGIGGGGGGDRIGGGGAGTVTVSGSATITTVTGGSGGSGGGSGIGGGGSDNGGGGAGTITVSDSATITTVTGGSGGSGGGSGIGGGGSDNGGGGAGTVTVSDSATITTVTGGSGSSSGGGSGIGGGGSHSGGGAGTVTVSGSATITTVTGGSGSSRGSGSGIGGGGSNGSGGAGTVIIEGGTIGVRSVGTHYAIGGGKGAENGTSTIVIDGGSIYTPGSGSNVFANIQGYSERTVKNSNESEVFETKVGMGSGSANKLHYIVNEDGAFKTEFHAYTDDYGDLYLYTASGSEPAIIKEAPNTPILELDSKTATTITLKQIIGAEYRTEGGIWKSSNEFSGLTPDTEYKFYTRIAQTDTEGPSPQSLPLTVKTNTEIPTPPIPANNNGGGSGTGQATVLPMTTQQNGQQPQQNTTNGSGAGLDGSNENASQNASQNSSEQPVPMPPSVHDKSIWLWMAVGIVAIVVIGGVAYWYFVKRK